LRATRSLRAGAPCVPFAVAPVDSGRTVPRRSPV